MQRVFWTILKSELDTFFWHEEIRILLAPNIKALGGTKDTMERSMIFLIKLTNLHELSMKIYWHFFHKITFLIGSPSYISRSVYECYGISDEKRYCYFKIVFKMKSFTGTWSPIHTKVFAIDFWPYLHYINKNFGQKPLGGIRTLDLLHWAHECWPLLHAPRHKKAYQNQK